MRIRKVVYVAGKYRDETPERIDRNIRDAWLAAKRVWEAGHVAICPHTNTMWMSEEVAVVPKYWQSCVANTLPVEPMEFIEGDLELVQRCDAMFMVHNWRQSQGARKERQYAMDNRIPVYDNWPEMEHYLRQGERCHYDPKTNTWHTARAEALV